MILTIGNNKVERYNNVNVTLQFDSVASVFSFEYFFDPNNALHRQLFRPGSYHPCQIQYEGETLITGTSISSGFVDSARKSLTGLNGYSKPGVLSDCEIPTNLYPLQSNGLSLYRIAERLCKPFGISVVVDPAVDAIVNQNYSITTASDSSTIESYLSELASQKNVVVSHDEKGNLLLTTAKTKPAIFDFTDKMPGTEMSMTFDGREMHNTIVVQKQATKGGKGNSGYATITNPYCNAYRPATSRQTSSENVDTQAAARNALAAELAAIQVSITIKGWKLNNKIVRPNNYITIQNPDIFIYNKTRFFIKQVEFRGGAAGETATLTCVLPEVFNGGVAKNIFE